MKLWDKGAAIDKKIESFTIGQDKILDLELAAFDVMGSLAHATMLQEIGLLTKDELTQLSAALQDIYETVKAGEFVIEDGIEDVHSQVELMLTRQLGDIGKKVHSGRSRNDQVLLDLRLYFRNEIRQIVEEIKVLFETLTRLSEQHKSVLLPGYTHTQVAMPSSFGLWFGAYAESLTDDLTLLQAAYKIVNQNPLGSAAGYGNSFPLNRTLTTQLLGFEDLSYNVVYAQMGRGKVEKTLSFALSSVAGTLAKFADDVCLYLSQNFGFISFPDHLTTGSSIMPHKKNPDVFELIRAHCNKIQALPNEVTMITANLTSGYHRDFQILKENVFPAIQQLRLCLDICNYALQHISVNEHILEDEKYIYLFSVESVNKEVLDGLPFRDAYKKVGETIEKGNYQPEKQVHHTHEGSIGNLCTDQIRKKMDKTLNIFQFQIVDNAINQLLQA